MAFNINSIWHLPAIGDVTDAVGAQLLQYKNTQIQILLQAIVVSCLRHHIFWWVVQWITFPLINVTFYGINVYLIHGHLIRYNKLIQTILWYTEASG